MRIHQVIFIGRLSCLCHCGSGPGTAYSIHMVRTGHQESNGIVKAGSRGKQLHGDIPYGRNCTPFTDQHLTHLTEANPYHVWCAFQVNPIDPITVTAV